MKNKTIKRNLILGILFFLPVVFLLLLYPAQHHYTPLPVVKNEVLDVTNMLSVTNKNVTLKDHLSVIHFPGNDPEKYFTEASNLKELVYDAFTGFKKFQVISFIPFEAKEASERLRKELTRHQPLKYWQFVYASQKDIDRLFSTLRTSYYLNYEGQTPHVYIIDKDLNQRGRLDDRSKKELEKKTVKPYPKTSYNTSEVSDLKNKLSEDLRVLFTEYRQKRKGDFNSNSRRESDIKK